MKKVVFGMLIAIGTSVWSYGAEMATISEFPVIACKKQKNAKDLNMLQFYSLVQKGVSIPESTLTDMEKNGYTCTILDKKDTRIKVYKKTKKIIKNNMFPKGQLTHFAKIKIYSIGGKIVSKAFKNELERKYYEKTFYWISLPLVDKKLYMFKQDNGQTW